MLQQPSLSPPGPAASPGDGAQLPFALDPNTAKQMAALQATSLAKVANRSAPGGVSSASYFGGISAHQLSRPDSTSNGQETQSFFPALQHSGPLATPQAMNIAAAMQQQQQQQQQLQQQQQQQQQAQQPPQITQSQRKRQFLGGLASVMLQRGTPLPPALTGMPYPSNYDPSASPWRTLETSNTDVGVVRLAGKDVDLFRLWAAVQSAGGVPKLNQGGGWLQLLAPFDLPETYIAPNGQQQQTVLALQQYYQVLLGPFEEVYRKNNMARERAAAARNQAAQMAGAQSRPGMSGTFPPVGTLPAITAQNGSGMLGQAGGAGSSQPTDASFGGMNGVPFSGSQGASMPQHHMPNNMNGVQDVPDMARMNGMVNSASAGAELNGAAAEHDGDNRKRKLEDVEDVKRVKHRSSESAELRGSMPPSGIPSHMPNMNAPSRPLRQPSRRKIEYIPFAREVDTAGGRDLDAVQQELHAAAQRPLRDLNEWGTVDIEALTLSLRSRISTELSYALTTFTVLTLLRPKETGFALAQVPDLFEELMDLIEDIAFGDSEEDVFDDTKDVEIVTHRHLVNTILEEQSQPFAGLKTRQGDKAEGSVPYQRQGDIIICAMNIIRNLSTSVENIDYMAKHERLFSILMRLCSLKSPPDLSNPLPLSSAISINDLLSIRKDTISILIGIAFSIHFPTRTPPSPSTLRDARRAFNLLASFLIDPAEAVSPFQYVRLNGPPANPSSFRPSSTVDSALEVFTRLTQSDDNRLIFARAVPHEAQWSMFEALVHRLPVSDHDFTVIHRQEWLAHMERLAMALYSLAFLAPPQVKRRVKADRHLAFRTVMLRLLRKLVMVPNAEHRTHWLVTVRRIVEAMKLVDDASDAFDASTASTGPVLSFGMGYGEHGESREEKGMGLLSGHQEEITWGLMLQREILSDEVVFSELTSLARVQPTSS